MITASKSPLPIRTTFEQGRKALEDGAIALQEIAGSKMVVFAVVGDMVLMPVFEAATYLEAQEVGVRIVSVVNPRRLYRPTDVAWDSCAEADGGFLDDAGFEALFGGDALIGVTAGASGMQRTDHAAEYCQARYLCLRSSYPTFSDCIIHCRNAKTFQACELMLDKDLIFKNLVRKTC